MSNKSVYSIVSTGTQTSLSEPTFSREIARATLQTLKGKGVLDAVIKSSKINLNDSKRIR